MKKLIIIFLVFSFSSCASFANFWRPTNHNQLRNGIVTVKIDVDWREPYRTWIRESLETASRFGPTFIITESGNANVVVYESRSTNCGHGAGIYQEGTRYILINPYCTSGNRDIFQIAIVHELGHFLGLMHVCRYGETDEYCLTQDRGEAIMNPTINGDWEDITQLDIREFTRVCGNLTSPLCNYRRLQELHQQ